MKETPDYGSGIALAAIILIMAVSYWAFGGPGTKSQKERSQPFQVAYCVNPQTEEETSKIYNMQVRQEYIQKELDALSESGYMCICVVSESASNTVAYSLPKNK